MSTAPSVDQTHKSSFQIFYEQSCWQIILFSMLSGGLYQLAWTYRFWRHFRRNALNGNSLNPKDAKVKPVISALFSQFYLVGACRRIEFQLRANSYARFRMHGWLCFVAYIGVSAAMGIAPYYGFSKIAAVLIDSIVTTAILVWIQKNANLVNQIAGQSSSRRPLLKKDFLWGIWGILIIFGLVVGDEDPESVYSACMSEMSSSEFSLKDQRAFCNCAQAQFNQYSLADPEKVAKYCSFNLPRS